MRAIYNSPNGTQTFAQPVSSAVGSVGTGSRIAHLHSLRSATKFLQDDINTYLTAKMEEDKQAVASNGPDANDRKTKVLRDEEEELNYGEEKVDDD